MIAKVLKSPANSEGHPIRSVDISNTAVVRSTCQTITTATVTSASGLSSVNDTLAGSIKVARESFSGPPSNYCNRRCSITTQRMRELRRQAHAAVKEHRTFTIRGCFASVRHALLVRGWVEKLDVHRKHVPSGVCQVTFEDLALGLPKRKAGETHCRFVMKCERHILSRFLEHMPIDFLWTNRKEKCDVIDEAKNCAMTTNKFHRAPFTSKEGLCNQLKEFHWHYEPGIAELYFPRCFNVWSPEELKEFIENFRLTASIAFVRCMVNRYKEFGFDAIFSTNGKIPSSAVDFARKRCTEYIEACQHNDIDVDSPRILEHSWDSFLQQQQQLLLDNESGKILVDPKDDVEPLIATSAQLLDDVRPCWQQFSLDGHQNLWIVKPANKCRGRGIQLIDNLKQILSIIDPSGTSKSRFVVQKYIERPLIIYNTKFDIRQWFLITNVQPLVVWMYNECYLRFSSQEYSLSNHHESVHLTNHAIQKKYANCKRDKRLPSENMWDICSFQAYLRQIGKSHMWQESIYPGMRKAIVGTMLASQENLDRHPNTFELFGADFMITEDFRPWLIEINSSPDLRATTSVTARMSPQCLEDVIKVVIDRRTDPKADVGNFELAYRQTVPPTLAYMGINLSIKGTPLTQKINGTNALQQYQRREPTLITNYLYKQRTAASSVQRAMPIFNATEYIEKCLSGVQYSGRSSVISDGIPGIQLASVDKKFTDSSSNRLKVSLPEVGLFRGWLAMPHKTCAESGNVNKLGSIKNFRKRHCSCGPRLHTNSTVDHENPFCCIIVNSSFQGCKGFDRIKANSSENISKNISGNENAKQLPKILKKETHNSTIATEL